MNRRKQFLSRLAQQNPSRLDQAIALLWYYEQTQSYTERTALDLVSDIKEDGFGSQNSVRLKEGLKRSKLTVYGTARESFRINAARFQELSGKYASLADVVEPEVVSSSVIPLEFVSGTRIHIERLVKQINGSYDAGFFDASSVIIRRLMESLLVEIYVAKGKQAEIKQGGVFMQLSNLINHVVTDPLVDKSRGFNKGLNLIKDIGDTAAHNRTYITPKEDIDDNKIAIRKIINELLVLSGIKR